MLLDRMRIRFALVLTFAATAFAQHQSAPDLLAKALAAYNANHAQQDHWNWTTEESRSMTDGNRHELQSFPDVVVESVIRKDGRRCNAVLSWGDGVKPYMLNGEADARCGGEDPSEVAFQFTSLLKSAEVKLVKNAAPITLSIQRDKSRLQHTDLDVRCAASIRATIRLDSKTYFPMHVEGEVVDNGCEASSKAELHYGESQLLGSLHQMLHMGTTFRLDYALQQDKFGHPERSYWILAEQQWTRPFRKDAQSLVYMNRRFSLSVGKDRRLLDTAHTKAQEFGAQSRLGSPE